VGFKRNSPNSYKTCVSMGMTALGKICETPAKS
jgi:hypothetical protein